MPEQEQVKEPLSVMLRRLAAKIEKFEGDERFHVWGNPRVYASVVEQRWEDSDRIVTDQKEALKDAVKRLGNVDKEVTNDQFQIVWRHGEEHGSASVELEVYTNREAVCVKRVVGTQMVTKKVYPDVTPVDTLVEEEIVEWDCPPLLA